MHYIFKKKIIPTSLLARFVLIIVIPILAGQFFALHLFYKRHWYNVSNHTSKMLISEIISLSRQKELLLKNKNQSKKYLNLTYILLPEQNLVKNQKNKAEELQILEKHLRNKIRYPNDVSIDKNNKITLSIQLNQGLLKIILPSKILLNPTTYIFTLWIIFITILLLSILLIFSKNQIKSILELAAVAEKYGRGEKIDNYKPSGAKEIRKAGLAFIKMKKRIERQTARRTQMLAMISHDLKTPLTRMKLQVELMNDSDEKKELSYDINSMEHMISSYLDFAKGEGGENFQKIELNDWITNFLKKSWKNQNIEIITKEKNLYAQIKTHSFTRALNNIISNAVKYSTKIKISIYLHNMDAVITIEDNGKGVKESERNKVFKPFYRENKARTLKNSTNVGLGLAITKEIIIGHYGSISLKQSSTLKGLLVYIKIPAIK